MNVQMNSEYIMKVIFQFKYNFSPTKIPSC